MAAAKGNRYGHRDATMVLVCWECLLDPTDVQGACFEVQVDQFRGP